MVNVLICPEMTGTIHCGTLPESEWDALLSQQVNDSFEEPFIDIRDRSVYSCWVSQPAVSTRILTLNPVSYNEGMCRTAAQ